MSQKNNTNEPKLVPTPEEKVDEDFSLQEKVFNLYCRERMSKKKVAEALGIDMPELSAIIKKHGLTSIRSTAIVEERKQVVKRSYSKLANAFSDSISIASDIIAFYKDKLDKSKKDTGSAGEFISKMDAKDFQLIAENTKVIQSYMRISSEAGTARSDKDESNVDPNAPIVVEFSEGYTPELLVDERFDASDAVKALEAPSITTDKTAPEFIVELDEERVKEEDIDVEIDSKDKL